MANESVIVVGAGPGGLAAAMLLARAGLDVHVFERRPTVGGRTTPVESQGFKFDAGPTFFLCPHALQAIFAACGYDLNKEVTLVKLDPMYRFVFSDRTELTCGPHAAEMERHIAALSPRDAGAFLRWVGANRKKLARIVPTVRSACGDADRRWSLRRCLARRSVRKGGTLIRELQRFFKDPRLRAAFAAPPRYVGLSPFACLPVFSVLSYLEYEYDLWHPIGGIGGLAAVMARIARELGAQIHLGESVREVVFDGRRAEGVITRTGKQLADAVVVNADFAEFMLRRVPYHVRPTWSTDRLRNAMYSCAYFVLLLGIQGRYEHLAHHTIYIPRDYERNMEEMEIRHAYSEQPTFYVQNACLSDDTLAPAGMSTLAVHVPVTHRDPKIHWTHKREMYRDLVVRKLELIGVDGLQRRIRFERVITPREWEKEFHLYNGAAHGLAQCRGQILADRPHNRFEDTERLYLVGCNTHPGGFLAGVYESARLSVRLLLQDLGMEVSWLETPPAGVPLL